MLAKLFWMVKGCLCVARVNMIWPIGISRVERASHFLTCSCGGCHLLELVLAGVATPEDHGGPHHDGVLLGVVGRVVAWDLKDGRDRRLVLNDHIAHALSTSL